MGLIHNLTVKTGVYKDFSPSGGVNNNLFSGYGDRDFF